MKNKQFNENTGNLKRPKWLSRECSDFGFLEGFHWLVFLVGSDRMWCLVGGQCSRRKCSISPERAGTGQPVCAEWVPAVMSPTMGLFHGWLESSSEEWDRSPLVIKSEVKGWGEVGLDRLFDSLITIMVPCYLPPCHPTLCRNSE